VEKNEFIPKRAHVWFIYDTRERLKTTKCKEDLAINETALYIGIEPKPKLRDLENYTSYKFLKAGDGHSSSKLQEERGMFYEGLKKKN